jgi:hypothetical protein
MATSTVARELRSGALDQSAVRRWVERTCAEQGIAVAISDTRTIGRVVALLGGDTGAYEAADLE